MRIIFMGTPEFALPALQKLVLADHEIVAVYTQPDRSSGRGRRLAASAVKKLALENNLPVIQPETLKNDSEIRELRALNPDVIVVVAYGRMLPKPVLDIPEFGCLNIHPSLLPKYRGASPVASAILNGDEETGVTVMLLDEGMDSGSIVSQAKVSIRAEDTTLSLTETLADVGADLLVDTLPRWVSGEIRAQNQDDDQASYTETVSKSDGQIDWSLSAIRIWRRLRAFYPWPGCYTLWRGKTLKIIEAIPLPAEAGAAEPGQVVALPFFTDIPLGVGTGDGILGVFTLQLEGRRAVSSPEFLRGQQDFIGQRLG